MKLKPDYVNILFQAFAAILGEKKVSFCETK